MDEEEAHLGLECLLWHALCGYISSNRRFTNQESTVLTFSVLVTHMSNRPYSMYIYIHVYCILALHTNVMKSCQYNELH